MELYKAELIRNCLKLLRPSLVITKAKQYYMTAGFHIELVHIELFKAQLSTICLNNMSVGNSETAFIRNGNLVYISSLDYDDVLYHDNVNELLDHIDITNRKLSKYRYYFRIFLRKWQNIRKKRALAVINRLFGPYIVHHLAKPGGYIYNKSLKNFESNILN